VFVLLYAPAFYELAKYLVIPAKLFDISVVNQPNVILYLNLYPEDGGKIFL